MKIIRTKQWKNIKKHKYIIINTEKAIIQNPFRKALGRNTSVFLLNSDSCWTKLPEIDPPGATNGLGKKIGTKLRNGNMVYKKNEKQD